MKIDVQNWPNFIDLFLNKRYTVYQSSFKRISLSYYVLTAP